MMQDQLTRAERIRLEALSQAISIGGLPMDQVEAQRNKEMHERGENPILTLEVLLVRAERIAKWLTEANDFKHAN